MEDICSYYGTVCIYKHGTFLTSCLSIAAEYRVSAGSPSNPCNTRLEINYLFLVLLNASWSPVDRGKLALGRKYGNVIVFDVLDSIPLHVHNLDSCRKLSHSNGSNAPTASGWREAIYSWPPCFFNFLGVDSRIKLPNCQMSRTMPMLVVKCTSAFVTVNALWHHDNNWQKPKPKNVTVESLSYFCNKWIQSFGYYTDAFIKFANWVAPLWCSHTSTLRKTYYILFSVLHH